MYPNVNRIRASSKFSLKTPPVLAYTSNFRSKLSKLCTASRALLSPDIRNTCSRKWRY